MTRIPLRARIPSGAPHRKSHRMSGRSSVGNPAFTRMTMRGLAGLFVIATAALLSSCASAPPNPQAGDSAWRGARQMVLVVTDDWEATTGTLRTFARDAAGQWREQGDAAPVSIGRGGSGWGLGLHRPQAGGPVKQEGDGRSPAGVFAVGEAFGYAGHADTALPYAQMQADSWCMDVVDSPLYNRIVDAREVGDAAVQGSSEPMRLDLHRDGDQGYRNGFVIEHNPAARKGAGSCIFAHLWKAPGAPTAGCTAMADATMQRLYGWLRPEAKPVFVLLPKAEYDRLAVAWHLP